MGTWRSRTRLFERQRGTHWRDARGDRKVCVKGTLTDEGVECEALRAEGGQLYTVVGDLNDFKVGDMVYVLGTVVSVSFCMQGITIAVGSARTHRSARDDLIAGTSRLELFNRSISRHTVKGSG